MKREMVITIFNELKEKCPGLLLAGSTLRGKEQDVQNLDLIWVGKIFPIAHLPIGEMDTLPKLDSAEVLKFTYKGVKTFIYRTNKNSLGAMLLHLTGPKEYSIFTRIVAKKKGYRLNQYGLFKGDKCVASKTEKEILDTLGIKHLEPVDRSKFKSIKI
jgi:DNA polymerase (family 10)